MSRPISTVRGAARARVKRARISDCSQAVPLFIDRLAKRPPKASSSTGGRSSRAVEVPITTESKRGFRATIG
jgi:hypothetical protein